MASKDRIRVAGLRLLYFSRFLTTTVPAQAMLAALFFTRPKLPPKIWVYLIVVASYWAVVFVLNPTAVPLKNLLFYFSFVLPSIVLISSKPERAYALVSDRFIVLVCGLVVLEAIIFNSPLAGYFTFLLPVNWSSSSENVRLFGFYQRPLGIAGNASMTSGVLIFSAILGDITDRRGADSSVDRRSIVVGLTVLLLASGTGFGLLLLYVAWRGIKHFEFRPRSVAIALAVLALPVAGVIGAVKYLNDVAFFNKFGSVYAMSIFDVKLDAVRDALANQAADPAMTLFGNQVSPSTLSAATSNDFGFLTMYGALGIVGAMCLLAAPLLYSASWRRFAGPTIFFYMTFIHYPSLLSPPGAVLFGFYVFFLSRHGYERR